MPRIKALVIGYWIATALFCLQMGFTAYAQLHLPQVAEAFTHLGFPSYFRVELSWAKLAGVIVLLAAAPARLKEWAYAGFCDQPCLGTDRARGSRRRAGEMVYAAGTAVLWAFSYGCWRLLQADHASLRSSERHSNRERVDRYQPA